MKRKKVGSGDVRRVNEWKEAVKRECLDGGNGNRKVKVNGARKEGRKEKDVMMEVSS